MLKRSKLLIALLVVTVICASIGFAAVQDAFATNGSVNLNFESNSDLVEEFDEDVYFSAARVLSATDASDNTVVNTNVTVMDDFSSNPDTATIGIASSTFTSIGQKVMVKYTVKNDAAYAVKLVEQNITNNHSAYFTVTCDSASANNIAANGGTAEVTYTITLIALPATSIENAAFSVTFNAQAAG